MSTTIRRPLRSNRRRPASRALVACLVAASGLLAACAYTETMNQRNTEGEQLRRELEHEQARTRSLSR